VGVGANRLAQVKGIRSALVAAMPGLFFLKFMHALEQLNALRTVAQRVKLLRLRQDLFRRDVEILAQRLTEGSISLESWVKEMKWAIKELHVTAAVIAKGGDWGAMTQADWGRTGAEIKKEYRYLAKFYQDVADKIAKGEDLTTALHARAKLYGEGAAMDTFSRILVAEAGVSPDDLPHQPGDGRCDGRCGCFWDGPYYLDEGIGFYWRTDPAKEHCEDCASWEDEYSPYVIPYPTG